MPDIDVTPVQAVRASCEGRRPGESGKEIDEAVESESHAVCVRSALLPDTRPNKIYTPRSLVDPAGATLDHSRLSSHICLKGRKSGDPYGSFTTSLGLAIS